MNLVFAIHGVGAQPEGDIQKHLDVCLRGGAVDARTVEFNWSAMAPVPARGGPLGLALLEESLKVVTNSALIEARSAAPAGRCARASLALTEAARVVLLAAVASLPVVPVVVLAAAFPLSLESWSPVGTGLGFYGAAVALAVGVAVGLAEVAVAMEVGRSIDGGDPGPAAAGLRRTALVLFLPLAALAVLPFAVIPFVRVRGPALAHAVMMAVGMVGVMAAIAALEHVLHKPGQRDPMSWGNLAYIVGMLAGMLAAFSLAVVLAAWVADALVPELLRVALDVLRYTGGQGHRATLQTRLAERFGAATADLGPADTVFLLGHSLGSVIAVDFLLNTLAPPPFRVVLVTGGSPVTRFFRRFFPGQFFPADLGAAVALLAARYGSGFRWVNVYRPRDPVGAALGFPAGLPALEASTGQPHSWLTAHVGYWGDADVHKAVAPLLAAPVGSAPPAPPAPTHACPDREYGNPRLDRATGPLLYGVSAVAVVLGLWVAAGGLYQVIAGGRQTAAVGRELREAGVRTTADVEHYRVIISLGDSHSEAQYDDVYTVRFWDAAGKPRTESFSVNNDRRSIDKASEFFSDVERLRDDVHARGELAEPEGALQLEITNKRRLTGVAVAFLPDKPGHVWFPDYADDRTWLGWAGAYLLNGFGVVVLGSMAAFVIGFLGFFSVGVFCTLAAVRENRAAA